MICDTGALLAAFDPDDHRHDAVLRALTPPPTLLVLPPYVLAELDYLLRREIGVSGAREALAELARGAYDLPGFGASDLREVLRVDRQYADLDLGVTDASIVVLAARYDTRDLLTLDHRHFRQLVPLQGGRFRLLPADA